MYFITNEKVVIHTGKGYARMEGVQTSTSQGQSKCGFKGAISKCCFGSTLSILLLLLGSKGLFPLGMQCMKKGYLLTLSSHSTSENYCSTHVAMNL